MTARKKIKKGLFKIEYIDENGEENYYLVDERIHYTYVLFLNNIPIYVGTTVNIDSRIKSHKRQKQFDRYLVLGPNYTDVQSTVSEKTTIALLKRLFPNSILNKNSIRGCSNFLTI